VPSRSPRRSRGPSIRRQAVDKASQQIGVSAEAFQELEYAAAQSSVSTEEFTTGMQFLAKNAYAASKGTDAQVQAFKASASAFYDANGKLKAADVLLPEVAEKISKMKDGTKKTGEAMELLGRSGAGMIKFLNTGAAGIDEMRARSRALGYVLSNETVKAGVELGDSIDDLGFAFVGPAQHDRRAAA
jgi:hypothetical protein